MTDVTCPYCGVEQEINHDDGYGYDESEDYEQECGDCEKTFNFTTGIIYSYQVTCQDNSVLLCFDDAISMAKGSLDYKGGYHSKNELEIYQHGIQTVINVLEAAKKKGLDDLQVAVVHSIGKEA